MKTGDFVGWADTWSDEEGCEPAGIIVEVEACDEDEDAYARYLILQHNGEIGWEYDGDLVVMFESR